MKNFGYFFNEVKTTFKLNLFSNIFSFLSTALIFFILATVISGWWISNHIVKAIQGESEISVYYSEKTNDLELLDKINSIKGVENAEIVNEEEAFGRMEKILGAESDILNYFDDNPFNSFIEIRINIDDMDYIIGKVKDLSGVEYIRDNREILRRISNLTSIIKYAGLFVVFAVGISTLVIVSYIIRQSIYMNKAQIKTLRLLGAPERFIGIPFVLEGLVITLGGGFTALVMWSVGLNYIYSQIVTSIPFIPLPSIKIILPNLSILIILLSILLGILGSFMGLSTSKNA